jgi:hypothetical protein
MSNSRRGFIHSPGIIKEFSDNTNFSTFISKGSAAVPLKLSSHQPQISDVFFTRLSAKSTMIFAPLISVKVL